MSRLLILIATALLLQHPLRQQMLTAEDQRASTAADMAPLMEGIASPQTAERRQAVRALGRFERAALIPIIEKLLGDTDPNVRAEAINAVGQAARSEGISSAKGILLARLPQEKDPRVRGVIAATVGRLAYTTAADVSDAQRAIAALIAPGSPIAQVVGAAEGLEALARQTTKIAPASPETLAALRVAALLRGQPDADDYQRTRRFARAALNAAQALDAGLLDSGLADPDEEVRRLTMIGARQNVAGREAMLEKGLADASPRVRFEALRTWGNQLQKASCAPVARAVRDSSVHVSLLAIDLLGNGCPAAESPAATLQALAEVLTPRPGSWHAPAHALVALAKVDADAARKMLPRYAAHSIWQVRMYAARAAGVLAAIPELEKLGRDASDNVREAALNALVAAKRPEAVPIAIEALGRPDYQLVLTAVRALTALDDRQQSPRALAAALARITAEKRDTSRDARMAILARFEQIGGDEALKLEPYLRDFDPAIASRAADVLNKWGKSAVKAMPQRAPLPAVDLDAIERLRDARLRFTIAGKGRFDVRLFVDEAPLTVNRVATRAREGYYNGLTFHRVEPNFVLQGGSPGANEYSGDGPFMRDEVGLASHRRGTIGISTRGRDTGDAQIFVNLVDLPRLDHTYTVFAEIVAGMDVVDAIVEGDVIERVEIVSGPRAVADGGPTRVGGPSPRARTAREPTTAAGATR